MKKLQTLAAVFLFTFVITAGMIAMGSYDAEAGPGTCKTYCAYELVCSDDTGPLCPDPFFKFYLYEMNGYCVGHPELWCPENVFPWVGCCWHCD